MLEGSVMEYVKWFVMIMGVLFVSFVVIMMFRMHEINSFQQEVNYQIERHGGLTDDAIADLDKHVKDAYGSCLIELDLNGEFPTGYPEDCKIPFYFKEYSVKEDGSKQWYERGEVKASFGTQIHYALRRPIYIKEMRVIDSAAIGTSVSRVRGD